MRRNRGDQVLIAVISGPTPKIVIIRFRRGSHGRLRAPNSRTLNYHVRAFSHALGHEDQFPPSRLSGRSAFREETFAGRCGNEKDAPLTTVRANSIDRLKSTPKLPFAVAGRNVAKVTWQSWFSSDRQFNLLALSDQLADRSGRKSGP